MEKLPKELLDAFMKGQHAMHHNAGIWNGIWSDMFIETTFMRYGPKGIIVNNAVDIGKSQMIKFESGLSESFNQVIPKTMGDSKKAHKTWRKKCFRYICDIFQVN